MAKPAEGKTRVEIDLPHDVAKALYIMAAEQGKVRKTMLEEFIIELASKKKKK